MNITEKKAFEWLITKGYKSEDFTFHPNGTPDFLTNDGDGYEVKLALGKHNKYIWFSQAQFDRLKTTQHLILVFGRDDTIPIRVLSSQELKIGVIKGIKIVVGKHKVGKCPYLQTIIGGVICTTTSNLSKCSKSRGRGWIAEFCWRFES